MQAGAHVVGGHTGQLAGTRMPALRLSKVVKVQYPGGGGGKNRLFGLQYILTRVIF